MKETVTTKAKTETATEMEIMVRRFKKAGFSDTAILELIAKGSAQIMMAKSKNGKEQVSEEEMTERVTEFMHKIGIAANLKGYYYVRRAIILCIKEDSMIKQITKVLYPAIAKEFGTTPSRVERAIRHAIEIAWDRGDVDELEKCFGYTISYNRGKATNSEFIATIADKFRLRYIIV